MKRGPHKKDTLGIQMKRSLKKADISTRGLRKNGVRDMNLEVISTWKVFKTPSVGGGGWGQKEAL